MARYAQELRERTEKNQRVKSATPNGIIELEGPIADPKIMRSEIDGVIASGLERALANIAEQVKDQAPSSQETGSRLKWSDETASYMSNRMTLKEGVIFRTYEDEDGNAAGEVYLHEDVEYIGRFVEYGHDLVLWGHNTQQTMGPRPFMRTAYEGGRDSIKDDIASGTKEALR